MQSDADIMRAVQNGQTGLFEDLAARYRPRLLRFAVSKLGADGAAEDAVQEALLAAFQARDSYRPEFAFSTWIYTILLNCCRRELRRRPRDIVVTARSERPAPSEHSALAALM